MKMLENNPPIHFERNLLNMLAVADRHEVNVLLVTFVTDAGFHHPLVSSEEYVFALAQHNEVTRRVARSTETPIYDMAQAFPDDPTLYTDGRHMTREGNLVRARLIGDFVMSEFFS